MLARRSGVTCTACRRPLIPAYPGQTLHPDPCDPAPATWTAEQLAEWGAIVDARKAAERAERARGRALALGATPIDYPGGVAALIEQRKTARRANELPDGPGAMPRPGPSGQHPRREAAPWG